ncbi:protein-disulfide reductase DsbD domain-containing protein [Longispora albida]|uniref:protein-disulfide reductase DsbD domain-containing protein n=1 Tax=Longispora albida TaxID=203523 RepID=UPI00035D0E1B|nr:protein-disulfide reductase DsbD domain-containing protein [Longispora albida]
MTKRVIIIAAAVLAVILLGSLLLGGGGKAEPATFTEGGAEVKVEFQNGVLAGDKIRVTLKPVASGARVVAGLKIEVSGAATADGEPSLPTPVTRKDFTVQVYSSTTVRATQPVKRPDDKPGQIQVKLTYQVCDKAACTAPVTGRVIPLSIK